MAMHPTAAASCIICYGSKTWETNAGTEECRSCVEPDVLLVRKVLNMLTPPQMAFLRAYGHTLAYQPVTPEEHDAQPALYVENDDAVWEDAGDMGYNDPIIPATQHWFASGWARLAHGGVGSWIKYNPLGLALRDCLMAGSDAAVPS